MSAKAGVGRCVVCITLKASLHQLGGRNFDHPRSNILQKNSAVLRIRTVAIGFISEVFGSAFVVLVEVDLREFFSLDEAGDGDG